jgi:hypothetical protein
MKKSLFLAIAALFIFAASAHAETQPGSVLAHAETINHGHIVLFRDACGGGQGNAYMIFGPTGNAVSAGCWGTDRPGVSWADVKMLVGFDGENRYFWPKENFILYKSEKK